MPIPKKPPLKVNCFKCQKIIEVKFVPPHKEYSKKNNWGYYTEKEKNKDEYVCGKCLIKIYKKQKRYFWNQVSNLNKRQKLRNYIVDNTI